MADRWLWLGLVVAFVIAVAVAVELIRPFTVGPVGFDSAASVAYFDRIVAGRHLEAFVTATPKPILTVVYGALHAATGDWRAISWATIAAFGFGVALAGWLSWRVAGLAAGVFAVIALVASEALLADVSLAYAVPWALVGWMVAGVALTADPPRFALGGLALAVGATARLETLAVIAVAAGAIALAWLLARRGRIAHGPDRRWWLVPLIGLAAIPTMLVHDWLLTGDPMFWLQVSAQFSQQAPEAVMTPLEVVAQLGHRYGGTGVTLLAFLGVAWLVVRRAWVPLVGLAGLGPGVVALLLLLAVRGTYVSTRYFAAIDVAMVLAAAAGAGAIAYWLADRYSNVFDRRRTRALSIVLGAILAIPLATWPIPSLDPPFRSTARAPRLQAERDAIVERVLSCALDAIPEARDLPQGASDLTAGDPSKVVVLVAGLERPRLAVDLGVPLDRIGGTAVAWAQPGSTFMPYGRLVFHDRATARDDSFAALEVDKPTTYGDVTLVPLLADTTRGIWVHRIDRKDGPAGGPACGTAAGS